ncbi:MAG TPA: hypothetical protein VKZ53_09965 [Candidatus Angelobacter sp.]|nr:hypothetical protein [Candidatus Angelobacter sp.]
MSCSLDLTGLLPTCKPNATVKIRLIADQSILQRVSLNNADFTSSINQTDMSVSFAVPAGRNTVVLVLLPPPTSEPMQIVEDCGGGKTQPILSFGSGIHASVSFDIIAG